MLLGEEGGEDPGHGTPVLDDVRDAAGHANVVLQHPEVPGLVPYEVDPGDVDPHPARWLHPVGSSVEVGGVEQQPPGHDAVLEGAAAAVGVGEVGLQGTHPLAHPALYEIPFEGVENAGHEVQRPGPLLAREGVCHAPVGESPGHLVGPEPQFTRFDRLKGRQYRLIGGPDLTRPLKHLVPRVGQRVRVKYVRHGLTLSGVCNTVITGGFPGGARGRGTSGRLAARGPAGQLAEPGREGRGTFAAGRAG